MSTSNLMACLSLGDTVHIWKLSLLLMTSLTHGSFMLGQSGMLVNLRSDSSPDARTLLETKYATIYQKLNADSKKSTYVMQNQSKLTIAGYVVKWTINEAKGVSSFYQMFNEDELLMNDAAKVNGFGLEPGKTRVLMPFVNLHEIQFEAPHSAPDIEHLMVSHPMARRLAGRGICIAQIDSVIFADGTFQGADEAGLLATFMFMRNAKHDAGVSVLIALQSGKTEEDIRNNLKTVISKADQLTSIKGKDGYMRARAQWAATLLMIDDHLGIKGLSSHATDYARIVRVELKRRPNEGS